MRPGWTGPVLSGRSKASQQNFISSNTARRCCNKVLVSPHCGRLSAGTFTKPRGVMCVRPRRPVEGGEGSRGAMEVRGRDAAAEAALKLAAAALQRAMMRST